MSDDVSFFFANFKLAATESKSSRYGHTFGGGHDRRGASRDDCNGILIHLLHRINMSDPSVPIQIPGLTWLPLYYVFDFRANELGTSKLSATGRDSLKRRVEQDCEFTHDFTDATDEDYEDLMCYPFMQCKPNSSCLNPDCRNHNVCGQLEVIALLPSEPVVGVHLWGGAGVQLIYELCPLCYTIRVSNQCA